MSINNESLSMIVAGQMEIAFRQILLISSALKGVIKKFFRFAQQGDFVGIFIDFTFDEEMVSQMVEDQWMVFFFFVQIAQCKDANSHFSVVLRWGHLKDGEGCLSIDIVRIQFNATFECNSRKGRKLLELFCWCDLLGFFKFAQFD